MSSIEIVVRREDGKLSAAGQPAVDTPTLQCWYHRGRLHREDGPAVVTPYGTELYYWKGVAVPRVVIMDPGSRSTVDILTEENQEIRRAWLEAYGLESALRELRGAGQAQVRHKTAIPPRRLWEISTIVDVDEEHPRYVEVTCPSTDRRYFLRVPPSVKTCEEAVAWTFSMAPEQYATAEES